MPIYGVDVPSESPPSLLEWVESDHVRGVAQSLLSVQVNDRDQVVKTVMCGKHRRFPNAALVAFGVTQQHEHPAARLLQPGRQGRPSTHRQALTQRAG